MENLKKDNSKIGASNSRIIQKSELQKETWDKLLVKMSSYSSEHLFNSEFLTY